MEDIVIRNLCKSFAGKPVLRDFSAVLPVGQVTGLMAPSGAGKTTLARCLCGLMQREGWSNPLGRKAHQAKGSERKGFLIMQDVNLQLFADSVLAEAQLGNDANEMEALAALERMDLSLYAQVHPLALSGGQKQRLAIVDGCLSAKELLIFDEPTAVLTPQEIDELMEIMRGFKAEGKSILFITHKLNEIMAVADRCTVLRKGKYIGTVDIANSSKEELSRMMVGRDVEFVVDKKPAQPGKTILSVQGMTVPSRTHKKDAVRNVSFDVRAGEIVCLCRY